MTELSISNKYHSLFNYRQKISENPIELSTDYNPNQLPNPEQVVASGYIITRISLRTLITKSWQQSFFVQYGSYSIFIFRSFADFKDWLLNPYHSTEEREFLVKLRMNFMSTPSINDFQRTCDDNGHRYSENNVHSFFDNLQQTSEVLSYSVSRITYKSYQKFNIVDIGSSLLHKIRMKYTTSEPEGGESFIKSSVLPMKKRPTDELFSTIVTVKNGLNESEETPMMHQFKVSRIMEQGPSPVIVGAFGSPIREELDVFRKCICSCIRHANTASGM